MDDLVQQQLTALIESSDDAIISKDLNGCITSWNRAAEQMFGYTSAEAIGQSIALIIPGDRLPEEDQVLEQLRKGVAVNHYETQRVRKDGTTIDVSLTVSPIKSQSGAVVGASKVARDISERRRLDRERQDLLERERAARIEAVTARERLAFLDEVGTMLTSSLDYEETLDRAVHLALPRLGDYCSVFAQDESGTLRLVASGHVDPAKEAIVREMSLRFVEKREGVPTFASDIARTGQAKIVARVMDSPLVDEVRASRPELLQLADVIQPFSYIGVPLFFRGRPIGVMSFGTTVDRSRREYSQADLPLVENFAHRVSMAVENARLFRQTLELNQLKDEFLATLSHELRTPLNAILGWARLLSGGKLSGDAQKRAVASIERSAQAQSKLIDDILDVARGIAGNLRLEIVPFDLAEASQRAVDAMVPTAAARQVALEVAAPAPVRIQGDPVRLGQVLGNLLSNAVKFTPQGGTVRVEVQAAAGEAHVRVIDTGIGISPRFLPHVFDKFRQGDGSFTRRYGGLGLGLAIARPLVELHGGILEAHSEGEGKGAMFVVRLPTECR